jgi:ubiquinone/menaquinone biosynthesis C-methylase UbiE
MRVYAEEPWRRPDVVAGFAQSPPNRQLIDYARRLQRGAAPLRVADIGCGAGRNAVPLAEAGCDVIGLDRSQPMLAAAAARNGRGLLRLIEAEMHQLPLPDGSIDLIVAHGIWNLARSGHEFRLALAEAARVAAKGAAAFVFTFSRNTLPDDAVPVDGESFVFTNFSGEPQVFLTLDQLLDEMRAAGFSVDTGFPVRELNLPPAGQVRIGGAPVIFEAAFLFTGR